VTARCCGVPATDPAPATELEEPIRDTQAMEAVISEGAWTHSPFRGSAPDLDALGLEETFDPEACGSQKLKPA
jgi:hypothetical protein